MSHVDDDTLHAYLDGELAAAEAARLEAHLAGCAACRGRLEEERALIARAGELLALAAPPEPARAAPPLHELRHPQLSWGARTPLAWAATLVLALATGWYLRGELGGPGRVGGGEGVALPSEQRPEPRQTAAENEVLSRLSSPSPSSPAASTARTRSGPAVAREEARAARDVDQVADAGLAGRQKAAEAEDVAPSAQFKVANRIEMAETWRSISAADARATLGAEPLSVPGVPVREIRLSPLGDRVVLVEQSLDSATVIHLFERRADQDEAAADARLAERGRADRASERLARYVGSLRVEITGPLGADSLNRLLERVRPIP